MTNKLYQSEDWQSLDKIDRAELLLVIEGLRKGALVGGNWTSFMRILEKTGLSYEEPRIKYRLNPTFYVGKEKDLLELKSKFISLPENSGIEDIWRINGEFLSYPSCCIREYSRDRTPEEESAKKQKRTNHLRHRFGRGLDDRIKSEGRYPDIFDYRPTSFTPCGITCQESIGLLTAWKSAITTLDPQAAEELVLFNRGQKPQRLAHKDLINKEIDKRELEYKIMMIRHSTSPYSQKQKAI